jgi:hypothetical protein
MENMEKNMEKHGKVWQNGIRNDPILGKRGS